MARLGGYAVTVTVGCPPAMAKVLSEFDLSERAFQAAVFQALVPADAGAVAVKPMVRYSFCSRPAALLDWTTLMKLPNREAFQVWPLLAVKVALSRVTLVKPSGIAISAKRRSFSPQ